jgi:hypothetical protein
MSARGRNWFRRIAQVAAAGLTAMLLVGQASPEAYRNAYRIWRLTDPVLERDSATVGEALGARADRVAAAAARYGKERRAFLDGFAQANDQKLSWIESPVEPLPALTGGASGYVATEMASVRRAIEVFASDPDAGLQQVRSMEEKENIALLGLNAAIAARQKATDDVDRATGAIEQARRRAVDMNRAFAANLKKMADDTTAEAAAWSEYYRKLSDGARATATQPVSTIASSLADPAPRTIPSVTQLPLARYTGDWVFPTGGLSFGGKPEFVDLVVRETNGHCDGRMLAKFILPPGSTGDPLVRFEFSGEFTNSKAQKFDLQTSDGTKGTIELIPGAAFNLLEINVQIPDAKQGKIRKANVVLVKK